MNRKATVMLCLSGLYAGCAHAQVVSPLSPNLYYEIGGGALFTRPLSENAETFGIGVGADLDLPMSCDLWDAAHNNPAAWGDLVTTYIDNSLNELGQAVVVQLTEFGQGLAVAALQRALPGLYDYSQNLTGQIEAKVAVSKRSCEAVVNDINNGVNPIDPWKRIAGAVAWRTELQSVQDWTGGGVINPGVTNVNILQAQEDIAASVSEAEITIPWFEGPAGGPDTPILVTHDLVTAGYNLHSGGAALLDEGTAPDAVDSVFVRRGEAVTEQRPSRLDTLFPSSSAAVDWATTFLGEQSVYTCSVAGCESSFQSGLGLSQMAERESDALVSAWTAIFDSDTADFPTITQLKTVSSGSVQLSPQVYQALNRFPAQDRDLYIGRLISDVSVGLTVEKALAIRKMILTSKDTPVVKGYVQASENANDLVQRIKEEIDDLMWGLETHHKLTSSVALNVLQFDQARTAAASRNLRVSRTQGSVNNIYDRPVVAEEN